MPLLTPKRQFSKMMKKHKKQMAKRHNEKGNAFFLILIGVILFAALSFSVARGIRSEGTSNLTKRQADLAATDIVSHAQRLERAVSQLRRKNISENDISFDNPKVSGYAHTPPLADTNKIFNLAGGGAAWKSPMQNVNDGSEWLFTGNTCIPGIGAGSTGCHSDTISNEELLAVLPNLTQTVCEAINSKLGISGIPTDSGGSYSTTKFTGTFGDGTEIILPSTYETACYSNSGYHFYAVLLVR